MLYSIELRSQDSGLARYSLFGVNLYTLLLLADACLLTGKVAKIEDACTAYLADFVEFDVHNRRRLIREDSLDTDAAGNLADCEGLGEGSGTADLDDHTFELLETILVTFLDAIGNGDSITGLELGITCSFVLTERLLYNFDEIHNLVSKIRAASS